MSDKRKIKTLEELASILEPLRARKKVVLCHGVFDLLHIGHIRHFEEAKARGDILVVTVTPDRYVNKGPDRPAFPEEVRVEAIAGLKCVDYVAVNRWPMAKETIELLRPNVFAKGSEYGDAGRDRTGAITVEEDAVRSVGGELVLTGGAAFSSSKLINRHLRTDPPAPEAAGPASPAAGNPVEVARFLDRFTERYSSAEVIRYLEGMRSLKVLVLGESIIDEYQYCEAIGKSSKEPMLAVRHLSTERFAGGILAVGNHLAGFCDQVSLLTFLGSENSQEDFIRARLSDRIAARFLHHKRSPTIVKRRLIENYFFTKLIEVYELSGVSDPEDERELCETLEEMLPRFDLVIAVDYGHGMIGEEAVKLLASRSQFLAVNAQSNAGNLGYHTISKYPRADYLCVTEGEVRLECRDRRGDLRRMVLDVSRRLDCPRVAVTRGKHGCLAYSREEGFCEVPAVATRVVDRLGAGDSFIALTAPCVYQMAPIEVVALIGNAVGAQAVATVGHRKSTERIPLFRHLECLMK